MCDRNKQEILARELCILWYGGRNWEYEHMTISLPDYTEKYWESFLERADELLEMLSKHED